MAIGSNTKSFTAVLMAMLADSGKLDWEKPVRDYLPDFQLYDAYATREMTPRDLVSHVSGLPRHDLLWYGRKLTRQELYQRLRYLEPSTSFRGRLQYNNLMFMTAGVLTERLTGPELGRPDPRPDLLPARHDPRQHDFERTGQSRRFCLALRARARRGDAGCRSASSTMRGRPGRSLRASRTCSSTSSSTSIRGGSGGRQLMSARSEARLTTPVVAAPAFEGEDPELEPTTYALGLAVTNFRGHRLVMHGGGIDGFISQMSWLPRERIGIVVLTNYSGIGDTPFPNFLTFQLYDMVLGLPPVDWAGRYTKVHAAEQARGDSVKKARAAERKPGTRPGHPISAYAGTYEHPGYGQTHHRGDR